MLFKIRSGIVAPGAEGKKRLGEVSVQTGLSPGEGLPLGAGPSKERLAPEKRTRTVAKTGALLWSCHGNVFRRDGR